MRIMPYCNQELSLKTPNFGTTSRFYKVAGGTEVGTYSWMFRDDIDWNELVAYELENFKEKDMVNVVQFASSDGSEAFTKLIAMKENGSKDFEKFYPIKAYDIDEEVVKSAKSGLVNFITNDYKRIKDAGVDYKKYFYETKEELYIKNDRMYHLYGIPVTTYGVSPELLARVEFRQADMFDVLKRLEDNSDTVVLCRNAMSYLLTKEVKDFVRLASEKLKEGSLLVLGGQDLKIPYLENLLKECGFKTVIKNVYRKIV